MRKFIMLIAACLFLSGCTSTKADPTPSKKNDVVSNSKDIVPLDAKDYKYLKVHGFVFENLVLLSRQMDTGFQLVLRNIYTADEKVIYKTEAAIIQVEQNEDGTLFGIIESSNANQADVKVINRYGDLIWEKEYVSASAQLYWNEFKNKELYVQYFQRDWTYKTDEVDLENNTSREIELNQTFFEWASKNKIAYIDWGSDGPALTGTLMTVNTVTGKTEKVLDNTIAFRLKKDVAITFQLLDGSDRQIEIKVIARKNKKVLFSHRQPMVQTFSESLTIPFFDWSEKENALYFFENIPDKDGNDETTLFKGSKSGIEKIKTMVAAPILCDKHSSLILIGALYENIYDGKMDKWTTFINKKKD